MFFARINKFLEKTIGANRLPESHRRELMAEQVHSLVQMTPGMFAGCFLIVAIVLWAAVGTNVQQTLYMWAFAICSTQLLGFSAWLRSRGKPRRKSVTTKAIGRACIHAASQGILWAILAVIVMGSDNQNLKQVTIMALTGALCGSGFALSAIPQAVFAFTIPVVAGIVGSIYFNPEGFHVLSVAGLMFAYLLIIPAITTRYARNFSRHVATEIAMRDQKDVIGLLLNEYEENASDWLWEIDANGKVIRTSGRFRQVCGPEAEAFDEKPFLEFLASHVTNKHALNELKMLIASQKAFRDHELPLTIDGNSLWWKLTGKPGYSEKGEFTGYIGIGADITSQKTAENKISRLAHLDSLTGLLNRASFTDEMNKAIAKLERYGAGFGVMFLDLDKFKLVNDTRGHLVGDELLKSVANRIKSTVRNGDAVARLGGDEFAIILHENCDAGSAARLAASLIAEVSKPYLIDGEYHSVGVSIGIAIAPINGTRANQLLRNADLALYRSKADGRGIFRFFENQMDADERERRMLELELHQALENDEFELLYQPLISTTTGRPTTMEALIRWHHPLRGTISPAEFIPIAEQSTLIQEIGCWSIRNACSQAMTWPDDVVVAVNLSARHFVGSDIIAHTAQSLKDTGLPPHRLEFEITESLLINNTEEVLRTLSALKELGVTIALDDFGTGYSSLSYILKFPFDKIKIDRSFVKASSEDEAAKSILKMISTLGQSLNIRITAEGVETEEQVEFLRSINCDQFQGFLFAKPLNSADLPAFFADPKPRLTPSVKPAEKRDVA